MRAAITILLLGGGILLSASIHREQLPVAAQTSAAPLEEPVLSFTSARGRIAVSGTTASSAHEDRLRQAIADHFPAATSDTQFRAGILPGAEWELTSTRLVHVISALDSVNAEMRPDGIEIRGVGSDIATFTTRVDDLRGQLAPSMTLTTDVVVVTSRASFNELCARAFAGLALGPVSFHESSAEIRPVSLAALDRITDFAHDCPSVTIAITGHTDGSGDETWNRQLSLARAQTVANHIVANGIDPARLIVSGAGSTVPVANNSTARGRERNRRIEFELR